MMNFDEAFESLRLRSIRLADRLLDDHDAAQEIAGEALTRLFEHWELLGHDLDHATAWTLRVTRNLCIDAVRRQSRESELSDLGELDVESEIVLRVAVTEALARLPRRQREVITLRYLTDLPQAEVAAVLGVRPGTVAIHTSRGLARLRHLLHEPRKDTPMTVNTLEQARSLVGTDRPVRARLTGRRHGGFDADIGIPAVYRGRGQRRPRWGTGGPDTAIGDEFDCVIVDIGADELPVVTEALTGEDGAEFESARRRVAALRPGQRFRGRIAVVLPFGAFVDIGGLRGLLHVSLLDPETPPQAGDEIEVHVLDTDVRLARISLGPAD